MAKKPATRRAAATTAPAHPDVHEAMDWRQHEATYTGFMEFVKWSIVAMALVVVALYCFIEAHNPILGTLALLAIPVGAIGITVIGSRRS